VLAQNDRVGKSKVKQEISVRDNTDIVKNNDAIFSSDDFNVFNNEEKKSKF